jgi:type I restriction-modification system DNA methylase subunit
VTLGTARRQTGTQYTPRSLTESVVKYALEPVVYAGPAEGIAEEEWQLKSAAQLLDLKICDFACGSGAFLVAAARYLGARLVEAWDAAQSKQLTTSSS